jgi:hypothetical protein
MNNLTSITKATAWLLLILFVEASCSKSSDSTPQPGATSISKNPVAQGESFTITGDNFDATAVNNTLAFGVTNVPVTSSTTTTLSATLPANFTAGSYSVSIKVHGHTVQLPNEVHVVPATPSITSFTPTNGGGVQAVTVTGTNFDPTAANNIVTLGSSTTPIPVTAASATSISFAMPANQATGSYAINISVKQNNETSAVATSAAPFVLIQSPTITDFSPTSAAAGQSVTINGTNFSTTPANNIVKFGSLTAVVTSATATQLVVTVPAGVGSGLNFAITEAVVFSGVNSAVASSPNSFLSIELPTVTTAAIGNYNEITAASGGNVTNDGGATVTQRGVCWSTSANPTITDQHTTNGSGTGSYSSNIDGLYPGVTYHVRAYATSSSGTGYGDDVSFTTTSTAVLSGLVAYYKFNGDAKDYSGQNNHFTATNVTYVSDHNGTANSAASFNGSSSKGVTSNGTNFGTSSSASVSIWFYGITTSAWTIFQEQYTRIMVYDESYGTTGLGQCSPSCDAALTSAPSRNAWHHFVGLYDGPNKQMKVYIDNVLVATSSMSSVADFTSQDWYVGYSPAGSGIYWQGYVGKTKVYNRLLSDSEIALLYGE